MVPLRTDRHAGLPGAYFIEDGFEHRPHPLVECVTVGFRGRIVTNQLGGETPDAERHARRPAEPRGVADHHLDTPSSDVDAQRGCGLEDEAGADRGEDEPSLFQPADDLDLDAGLGLDAVDELAAVRRRADGARRFRDDLVRTERVGELAQAADAGDGAIRGRSRDPALAGNLVAEAEHLLLARDGLERAVGMHVGDEEVEGVGAEVERRDPHVGASVTTAAGPA